MTELWPAAPLLVAFLLASLLLAVTPGPGVLYIVARTLAQGRSAGLASAAGVALGNLGNAVGASVGLGLLFASSAAAFSVVKVVGAAYLVWLGVQALRQPAGAAAAAPTVDPAARRRILRDGFFVALLNPKTTLFFAAFLPQFIDSTAAPLAQALVWSTLFVLIAACTDGAYVLLAAGLAPVLRRGRSLAAQGRVFSAAVYIGLGVWTLFSDTRAQRASVR